MDVGTVTERALYFQVSFFVLQNTRVVCAFFTEMIFVCFNSYNRIASGLSQNAQKSVLLLFFFV